MAFELEKLKKDGYTERFAKRIINRMNNDEGKFPVEMIEKAHSQGFCALSIDHYQSSLKRGMEELDLSQYLKDYDYDKLWPLNGWMRIWVNDKLTLKYMLADTSLGYVMPEYYYYTLGGVKSLIDNPSDEQTLDAFITLLKRKKNFACKPANGAMAEGFYKLTYDGKFRINDQTCDEGDIRDFVENHPNYVFTEYLFPEASLSQISSKVPTIRIMVINKDGNNPVIVPSSYIRFGTLAQGASNYVTSDNNAEFTIFAGVNTATGEFGDAKAFHNVKIEAIERHPDTGALLTGKIQNWEEVRNTVLAISKRFFGVEWMGFDICVDVCGKVRIMEINTHPGITYVQVFKPLLSDTYVKSYFEEKLEALRSMNEEQIKIRNRIER